MQALGCYKVGKGYKKKEPKKAQQYFSKALKLGLTKDWPGFYGHLAETSRALGDLQTTIKYNKLGCKNNSVISCYQFLEHYNGKEFDTPEINSIVKKACFDAIKKRLYDFTMYCFYTAANYAHSGKMEKAKAEAQKICNLQKGSILCDSADVFFTPISQIKEKSLIGAPAYRELARVLYEDKNLGIVLQSPDIKKELKKPTLKEKFIK
ncbi:MAG: hypothetical protein KC478_17095, partial [Bacteriovoracaceae bacterium]|nr:hypothetical protein [Bacteriovoracaceae bacterium]